MLNKSILAACLAFLIAACATPAPETAAPAPASIELQPTSTPIPPTPTPSATPEPSATPVPRREIVLERGNVICGIDVARPDLAGFDVDFCRAVAAALFDDAEAIDVRPLDLASGAAALRSSAIDVFIGGPAHTGVPEGPFGSQDWFFDAAGAIARTDVGITRLADLKFATVCMIQGSIEERLFNEAAGAARVRVQPYLFNPGDDDAMYRTYDEGRCDAVVDNRVRLAQRLPALSAPREHALIDLTLPIGWHNPLTDLSDAQWSEAIASIGYSLFRAEELGVSSENVDTALSSDEPAVQELLLGSRLGFSSDFVARVIRLVGNYGEVYARHFPDLPRGPNALATDGGLIGVP
ncbi:MAG TPA: transporter substrate-binding domain-containing protein [Anaerolineae bacterium]|nr:transporter substrate-binding domain-containing protein [Anaerolineae bacterium]